MAITARAEPEHLEAAAGAEVEGRIVLTNPGDEAVHVRLVVTGEVAGWATLAPSDLWVLPTSEVACDLRFRLPRGAPGGVGAVPFVVRVLSDAEGEGGATVAGSLEVTGEAELALRLLPARIRGTRTAHTKLAIDNLGDIPARAQILADATDGTEVVAEPDSVIVEPNSTTFARVMVRPVVRHLTGKPRAHEFWVRLEPMGGARISAAGVMAQRSLVAGLLPAVAGGAVALIVAVALLARLLGGGGGGVHLAAPVTTRVPATTTTAAPATTVAAVVPGATTTTIPLKDRRIAFQTKRDGNFEVYSANPDGGDPRNLTQSPAHDGEPAWSPDHTRLAFDSDRAGGFDVYVMNADGTNVIQLTTEPAPDGYPSWSPDGTKIAFISLRDGNSEIYVMNADGTGTQRLTKNLNDDAHPVWSPDGTRIAFHTDRDGNYEVYSMNADGSDPKNLTNTPASDKNPSWSPNGARLAFDSTRDGSKAELYVMGTDGSLPIRLTTDDDDDNWPAWSPDGGRLAFQTDRDSDPEVYVVSAGGGPAKRLTTSPGEDGEVSW